MLMLHVVVIVIFHSGCLGQPGKHGGGKQRASLKNLATVHGDPLI